MIIRRNPLKEMSSRHNALDYLMDTIYRLAFALAVKGVALRVWVAVFMSAN